MELIWQTKEQGDIGEPVMGYANSETDHSNIVDIQPVESERDLNAAPATDKGQCRIYCRVSAGTTGGSRILLPKDMIIECTFVVVSNFGISCPAKQVATEFQHIVRTTSLTGISGQMFG